MHEGQRASLTVFQSGQLSDRYALTGHPGHNVVPKRFGAFISNCFRDVYVFLLSKIGLSRSCFNKSARFEPACETAFQGSRPEPFRRW